MYGGKLEIYGNTGMTTSILSTMQQEVMSRTKEKYMYWQ